MINPTRLLVSALLASSIATLASAADRDSGYSAPVESYNYNYQHAQPAQYDHYAVSDPYSGLLELLPIFAVVLLALILVGPIMNLLMVLFMALFQLVNPLGFGLVNQILAALNIPLCIANTGAPATCITTALTGRSWEELGLGEYSNLLDSVSKGVEFFKEMQKDF